MMLVSQDGQKAIDSVDVLAYYVYPFRADAEEYLLLAEPRRNYSSDFFGTLILYRHKDLTVVMQKMQQVLRFVADETLYVGGDGHDGEGRDLLPSERDSGENA